MKPMLFNTEMVRAILEGRKTVTRRVVKPQPKGQLVPCSQDSCWPGYFAEEGTPCVIRPPYHLSDILYVRETWCQPAAHTFWYKADSTVPNVLWRASIHMPREAARIFLRVTDVRVERLQEITLLEAIAEGIPEDYMPVFNGCVALYPSRGLSDLWGDEQKQQARQQVAKVYGSLWDSTIRPADRAIYGWEANPWVWVIAFERITKEEA